MVFVIVSIEVGKIFPIIQSNVNEFHYETHYLVSGLKLKFYQQKFFLKPTELILNQNYILKKKDEGSSTKLSLIFALVETYC